MESMLSMTSAKMTGLDLGGGGGSGGDNNNSTNSNPGHHLHRSNDCGSGMKSPKDDLLTTPKVLSVDYTTTMKSPRNLSTNKINRIQTNSNNDDVLTTPVLNTPKTSDLWSSGNALRTAESLQMNYFSPVPNLSPNLETGPRNPPKDLPMDSDIGLSSPCAGVIAKRRSYKTQQAASTNSINSNDSNNSCDTPTSQNSPRDLTVRSKSSNGVNYAADSTVQLRLDGEDLGGEKPNKSPLGESGSPKTFKRPPHSKPENLKFPSTSELTASHYTPSPLTVPSPNWTVVHRDFAQDMLKTPKQLDPTIFDFLTPSPFTSNRSNKFSLGNESDRYCGRDQRLSPRLSPRFPIPENPTDLSSKASPPSSNPPEKAEDLTTTGPNSGDKSKYTNSTSISSSSSVQDQDCQQSQPPQIIRPDIVKQEFNYEEMSVDDPRSRTPLDQESIKTEILDEFEYSNSSNSANNFTNSFSVATSSSSTSSSMYLPHPVQNNIPCATTFDNDVTSSTTNSNRDMDVVLLNGGIRGLYETQQQMSRNHAYWNQQVRPPSAPHHWHNNDNDNSSKSHIYDQAESISLLTVKSSHSLTPSPVSSSMTPERKRRGKSATPMGRSASPYDQMNPNHIDVSPEKKANRGKAKVRTKSKAGAKSDGQKKVYSCPTCKRTYDWNYNLNRHLKYECGKENSFQCNKCNRRFPHKQNCVYHLKRKHKIDYQTIEEYVKNGYVVFKGVMGPAGQKTAAEYKNNTLI